MLDKLAARDSRRRTWRRYWHMRKKRGARCGRLERRYFRRHPHTLMRIERHWASQKALEMEPVVVCPPAPQQASARLRYTLVLIVAVVGLGLFYLLAVWMGWA